MPENEDEITKHIPHADNCACALCHSEGAGVWAKVKARNEIVGWHLDNEHQSICLEHAVGYDMTGWRPLPRHEADEFGDECQLDRKTI